MKKAWLFVTVCAVSAFVAGVSKADTDVFGTLQQIDGSYSIRRTTTEQFDPIRGQSVLARPRPDYDATPIAVSSFNVFPSIDFGATYNSNIFAQSGSQKADAIETIDPAVSVLSNWSRHAVALTATGDMNYYAWNNKQSFNGAIVQAEGRYDLAPETWLSGTAGYQRATELRGNPDAPSSQASPSQFNLYTGSAEFNRSLGLVKAKVDYDVASYEYSHFDVIGGGTATQSYRDRTQNTLTTQASYDYTENLKPYVAFGYNWRDYTNSGLRNSDGYKADVGARMDFGGITTAQAYIGYMTQDYGHFANGKIDSVDFGADLLWNVTSLTSVETKVTRSIEETTSGVAPAYIASGANVTVSHELKRNLLLEGSVNYYAADYQGFDEHDDFYYVSGGARYLINRNVHTDFTYGYQRKESTVPGLDFDQHIVMLRVGLQY